MLRRLSLLEGPETLLLPTEVTVICMHLGLFDLILYGLNLPHQLCVPRLDRTQLVVHTLDLVLRLHGQLHLEHSQPLETLLDLHLLSLKLES